MLRLLPVLAVLVLTIYALVDCLQTEESRQRTLPKVLWLLLILVLPLVGPAAWFLAGRPGPAGGGRSRNRPPYPRGPDDDPDFLRNL